LIRLGDDYRGLVLGKDWPWLLGIALCVGVALSIAAYALGSGTTTVTMLSAALIALALAQGAGLIRNQLQSGGINRVQADQADIAAGMVNLSNENRRINAENQNLARNVEAFRHETTLLSNSLSEGLSTLRQSHETVADSLKTILQSQQDIQQSLQTAAQVRPIQAQLDQAIAREQQWMHQLTGQEDAQEFVHEAAPVEAKPEAEFGQSPLADALNLSLEPIVDLYTSSTAHYRMLLGMTNEQGQDVPHDVFIHHAERMGVRDKLDQHVIEQTLGLLQQLRQRDQGLCIFVPVGAATLANPIAVQNILAQLAASPDMASGVVIDISHAVLASLSNASLEGLATMARSGVALSLSQASISGIDISALNRLNVRHVALAASSIGVGGIISAGLPGFVQAARALRIQIIISNVGDPRHVAGLAQTARFASGPAFALPRKLQRSLPESANQNVAA
jgi:EAL domain-containing protein (putative c-di-GMP-specific phosphodiesterase class I)